MHLNERDNDVNGRDELRKLREENARLKELLTRHGISWEVPVASEPASGPLESPQTRTPLTAGEKIALFRQLFRGREDAKAFMQTCRELVIPAALEISRSGHGAHAWIFFAQPVPAREARQLGAALISHTCDRTRQLSLTSYDRLFPNQDTMPKGGFGNLIALPLQKQPRESGRSVFVDEQLQPHSDQWAFLASIRPMSRQDLEDAILRASGGRHPLDVAFATEEEDSKPWQRPSSVPARITGPLPDSLPLVLANQIFITKANRRRNSGQRCLPSWKHWTSRHQESCSPPAA